MCTTFLQNDLKMIVFLFMTVSAVFILQATNIDLYLLPLILDTIYIMDIIASKTNNSRKL